MFTAPDISNSVLFYGINLKDYQHQDYKNKRVLPYNGQKFKFKTDP